MEKATHTQPREKEERQQAVVGKTLNKGKKSLASSSTSALYECIPCEKWSKNDVKEWLRECVFKKKESQNTPSLQMEENEAIPSERENRYLISEMHLQRYEQAFSDNEIDGSVLQLLTTQDLSRDLGIKILGHRKRIEMEILNLKNDQVHPSINDTSPDAEPLLNHDHCFNSSKMGSNSKQIYHKKRERNLDLDGFSQIQLPKRQKHFHGKETGFSKTNDQINTHTFDNSPKNIQKVSEKSFKTKNTSTSSSASSASTSTSSSSASSGIVVTEENICSTEVDEIIAKQLQPKQCSICLEEVEVDFLHPIQQCQHQFCRDCLSTYCKSKINERSIPFKCPLTDCGSEITLEDMELLVEPKFIQMFEEFGLQSAIKSDPNFRNCLTPDCGYVFFLEEGDKTDFKCPECGKRYCLNCMVEWHLSTTCEQYQKWAAKNKKADHLTNQFLKKEQGKKVQKCPKCSYWVQRSEGCNHMTCRCGHQFCYLCGETYPCNNHKGNRPRHRAPQMVNFSQVQNDQNNVDFNAFHAFLGNNQS